MAPLITLDNATFRHQNQTVLTRLSWVLEAGQQWAVVGPVGAGKTSFLWAIAGKLLRVNGSVTWTLGHNRAMAPEQLRREIALVNFKEESRLLAYGSFFYQQRYHAGLADNAVRLRDFLLSDENLTELPTALIARLRLEPLLNLAFNKLSNGQMRRALLAKALLKKPRLLLLDYPFTGLDAHFRTEFTALLTEIANDGLPIILVTDADSMPDSITHVIELKHGSITYAGPRQAYRLPGRGLVSVNLPHWQQPLSTPDFNVAFSLENVSVRHGENLILNAVNWTVERGQKWALTGPNGAGKSVLLSLLYGDHPQAYANRIHLFDRPRGESIWDIKKRIGFVSPELHLYFQQPLTCRAVALSGLTDTLVPPRTVSEATTHDCQALFDYFSLSRLSERLFLTVSTGEQRLVLLIRALLKRAACLILDEPFQALDPATMQQARHLLTTLSTDQTLLFVTHYRHEIPVIVTQELQLNQGVAASIPFTSVPLAQ